MKEGDLSRPAVTDLRNRSATSHRAERLVPFCLFLDAELLEQIIAATPGAGLVIPETETEPTFDQNVPTQSPSPHTTSRVGRVSRRPDPASVGSAVSELLRRRGRVKVPWRLVSSPSVPDASVSVYIKVAALGMRAEGCTAGVARLADYLRLSTSSVERGLRALSMPDPTDGVTELSRRRRTKPGGRGTTALRRTRPVGRSERFVWVPVELLKVLEPRQVRAWAALAYADAMRLTVAEGELGQILVHHSGKRAGEPIGAAAASAVVDSLEALGVLRVRRRAGYQGRHEYVVLEQPAPAQAHGVDSDSESAEASAERRNGSSVGDGSGSRVGDGSLADEEDSRTDGQEKGAGGGLSPAVGEVPVASREAPVDNPASSNTRSHASGSGDLALRAGGQVPSSSSKGDPLAVYGAQKPHGGPELTFSARMAWITAPVCWLLERSTVYVQRQVARELGAQLALGIEPARLRQRLERRFAGVMPGEIRNVGGWLLKVGVPRWGCHDPKCESGTLWASGEPCGECRAEREERRRARARAAAVEAGACPGCVEGSGGCPMCELESASAGPAEPTRGVEVPRPTSERASAELVVEERYPSRCPDCRSWAEGRGADGRCRPCGLAHQVGVAVVEAMDAAGARLNGRAKVAAALEAGADVRAEADRARAEAVEQGVDEDGICWAVLLAAQARAAVWTRTDGAGR